jgi:Family of unknown function (DUF5677)
MLYMSEVADWATFTREYPDFTTSYHKLFHLIAELVRESSPTGDDIPGVVICELMSTSLPDFDDILLLCSYDRHWGALKLLRGLFERTVTLKYLAQNPVEVDAFLAFDAVDWDAVLTGIEKTCGFTAGIEARESFKAAAKVVREGFTKCNKCGNRKQTSWTPRSSIELAENTGLAHLHLEAFLMPSKFIHPTYWGAHLVSSAAPAPLLNVLKITHTLTLETALVHQRYFKGDPLASSTVREAIQDFLRVWKFSDTDFGLGQDAVRAGLAFVPLERAPSLT